MVKAAHLPICSAGPRTETHMHTHAHTHLHTAVMSICCSLRQRNLNRFTRGTECNTVYMYVCVCAVYARRLFSCRPSSFTTVTDHPQNTHTYTDTDTHLCWPSSLPVVIMSPCVWSADLLTGNTCSCAHTDTHTLRRLYGVCLCKSRGGWFVCV